MLENLEQGLWHYQWYRN